MPIDWKAYNAQGIWDELVAPNGRARTGVGALFRVLGRLTDERLAARETAADLTIRTMGSAPKRRSGTARSFDDASAPTRATTSGSRS